MRCCCSLSALPLRVAASSWWQAASSCSQIKRDMREHDDDDDVAAALHRADSDQHDGHSAPQPLCVQFTDIPHRNQVNYQSTIRMDTAMLSSLSSNPFAPRVAADRVTGQSKSGGTVAGPL